jgi:hypothetical protein
MSEEEKDPADATWNEGWTIKRELERETLSVEFYSDLIEREVDGELIQALSYFARVGSAPCVRTKLNIQSPGDSPESVDLAYARIHDDVLRRLRSCLPSALAMAAKLVVEGALHQAWLALYAKTRRDAGAEFKKVLADYEDAMSGLAKRQSEFWDARRRLDLGVFDRTKGYRLPGLARTYERLLPIWQTAKDYADTALSSRNSSVKARWRDTVLGAVRAAHPILSQIGDGSLPDDLLTRLDDAVNWPPELASRKHIDSKPSSIALEHAARICGRPVYTDYALTPKQLRNHLNDQLTSIENVKEAGHTYAEWLKSGDPLDNDVLTGRLGEEWLKRRKPG